LLLFLFSAAPTYAQSVSLTGTVTDSPDSQTWNGGTITFTFSGNNPPYRWSGGAFNPQTPISATLSATGTYSASVPDNTQIFPLGSQWQVIACPATTLPPGGCYITYQSITTSSTVLNLTPPSPRLKAGSGVAAYNDTEVAAQVGQTYYSLTAQSLRFCQTVSAGNCTAWTGDTTAGGNNNFTGNNTFAKLNATVVVDGVTYAKTQTGIQLALNAAGCGGHVHMPAGTYNLTDTTSAQEIFYNPPGGCTTGFELSGEGGEVTILQVAANVPSTEDVIRIASTGTEYGFYLHDFYIQPVSGSPARYGINLDETNGSIAHVTVERIRIGSVGNTLGNYAIFNTNTLPSCNPLYLATFQDNTLVGGMSLLNMGDSILLLRNNITGPRDLTIQNVTQGCHGDGGSHGFQAIGNNITTTGGTVILNSWQGYFAFNDIEQVVNTTETFSALIDLRGTTGNKTTNFVFDNNYLGCNGIFNCAISIRVDNAVHTVIRHNLLPRGTGALIATTANADRTIITDNINLPLGEQITTWLSDLGTNTYVSWQDAVTGFEAHTPEAWGLSGSNTRNFYMTGVQFKGGNTSVMGFASGDPTGTGIDIGSSRDAAGVMDIGNGTAQDITGKVKMANLLLGSTIQNTAATSTMGLTLKKGSGAGNYSSASTTFTAVDGTNLTNTVTIPTGWKLGIQVSGAITTSTAIATASVGINDGSCSGSTVNLQRTQSVPTAATNPESFSLSSVITGDGASHTINLCYLTSNAADSVTMINSSSDFLPTMVFTLMPSN